jgi:hypothetical protein
MALRLPLAGPEVTPSFPQWAVTAVTPSPDRPLGEPPGHGQQGIADPGSADPRQGTPGSGIPRRWAFSHPLMMRGRIIWCWGQMDLGFW